jgi:hypothetical protein
MKKKRRVSKKTSNKRIGEQLSIYLRFLSLAILIARTFFIILRRWFLSAADKLGMHHG